MDKWLNQFTDNRLFMKLVALGLALLLFSSVYEENNGNNDENVPGDEETVTVTDIPVKRYYDTENLIITGVPDTVKVVLVGPTPNLQNAKAQKNFEVFVDLTNVKVGKQRADLQITGLSDKLKATIDPEFVEVNVQEKVTKEYTIDVDFNPKMIAEGFKAGNPEVDPKKVQIIGGKDVMDQIAYVRAVVELDEPVDKTIDVNASITVLDKDLNKLNVILNHEVVKVKIPVHKESKIVPIEIIETGTSPEGVTIESITLDTTEVTITGSEENLSKAENVKVEVNLSQIKENTEVTLPIVVPNGIEEVTPKTVQATITVSVDSEETATIEEDGTKTFSNLPIQLMDVPEKYGVAIKEPSSGRTSISVLGTKEELDILKESDFQLSVEVGDLNIGEHVVKLSVQGPENVEWKTAVDSISIEIVENEVS